jgi:subfamily B ATP-binding cassette protein MsbA
VLKKLQAILSTPSYQLIIQTATQNWTLIITNLITNILSIFFEGTTLGIIYIAISVLDEGTSNIHQNQFVAFLLSKIPYTDQQIFLIMLGAAVIMQTLLAVMNYLNKLSVSFLAAEIQPQVTGHVFRQIMSLSFGCASRYKVGDLVLYANTAGGTVNRQITTVNNLLISVSFTFVYTLILVKLSSILALIAVILSLAIIAIQRFIIPRLRDAAKGVMSANVNLSNRMTESIQALRLIHSFGTQQSTINQIDDALIDTRNALIKRGIFLFLPEPFLDVLPIFALAGLAAVAYLLDASSTTVLPLLLTFLVALQRLATRLRGVSGSISQLIDLSAEMLRLNNILDNQDKEFSIIGSQPFTKVTTDIKFQDVTLSYNNDGSLIFEQLNLVIPRNKVTALVGESGAGKSSLVDMLIGLYQPNQGDVIVDNESIYNFIQSEWRGKIGVVSQDTVVFNMTILENLKYGAPYATFEEVVEITKAAQAHKFILDLPKGYDTLVGERGYRLSGGQRQRLALARALIKQPEILILDEATSALDSQSEKLIQEALEQFQEGRTVIVIAHRLSTIVNADQIVVLERGKIVEMGTHKSLVEADGLYAKAWKIQTTLAEVSN